MWQLCQIPLEFDCYECYKILLNGLGWVLGYCFLNWRFQTDLTKYQAKFRYIEDYHKKRLEYIGQLLADALTAARAYTDNCYRDNHIDSAIPFNLPDRKVDYNKMEQEINSKILYLGEKISKQIGCFLAEAKETSETLKSNG
jgi:hypothetical protein